MVYKGVKHGTTDKDTNFSYINNSDSVAYFTDVHSVAEYFATMQGCGGLVDGEVATIIEVDLTFEKPLVVGEDLWEEVADMCNIDKDSLILQGYDGVICTNSSMCTYFAVLHADQIKEIRRALI